MKRSIIQTRNFVKKLSSFLRAKKLAKQDFEDFERNLVENPCGGDIIQGAGGIRKIRLKSISKGKSGGFRICYYYDQNYEKLYLIFIYQKNQQENLTMLEKKALRSLVDLIKGNKNEQIF